VWLAIYILIISLGVKTSIYSWYNSSSCKVHLHFAVRQTSSCGPTILLNEIYNQLLAPSICIQGWELPGDYNDTVDVTHPVNRDWILYCISE
jgi:hypothetical protein